MPSLLVKFGKMRLLNLLMTIVAVISGKQLDSVMNYPWKDAIIEFVQTKNAHALAIELIDHYPNQ